MTIDTTRALVPLRDLGYETTPSLDTHPAAVYLASLGDSSRPTMRHALDQIAGALTGGCEQAFTLNWSLLRYQHTAAVRSWLMDRYQPATVNKKLSALRRVLYHAWKLGQMSAEDSERARDVANLRYETIPAGRAVSAMELLALMKVCADGTPIGTRDAAMISILYGTGIRRSSVTALDVSDYHPDTGELTVRAKGRKTITAFVVGGAQRALTDWLALRGLDPGPLFCRVSRGGHITQARLTCQSVYDVIRRRSAQCGMSPATPHDLRRSFISDLLTAGVDTFTVQRMAGHASPSTTARYDRRAHEIMRSAANSLLIPYPKAKSG